MRISTSVGLAVLLLGAPVALSAQGGAPARAGSCERASALSFAAGFRNADAVRRLLDDGVGVDCVSTGKTPLMHAVRWKQPATVALLLERGADAELESEDGYTALEFAVMEGNAEISRMLAAHLGVADPLAPKRRERAAPAPAAAQPPAAPTRSAPETQATTEPASDVPVAATAVSRSAASASRWAPFGTFRVGDRVQFWVTTGWRPGTVTEVGTAGSYARKSAEVYERRYRISDDRFGGAGDWYDWGLVAGAEKEPFWTGYFTGDWALGEVMAVNTRTEGAYQRDEYSYHAATESLRINPDGTYLWKPMGKAAPIRGRWSPAPDGPGIVLHKGAEGVDWTLRNETNATEENIRSIESARLTTPNKMSIRAKRPIRK